MQFSPADIESFRQLDPNLPNIIEQINKIRPGCDTHFYFFQLFNIYVATKRAYDELQKKSILLPDQTVDLTRKLAYEGNETIPQYIERLIAHDHSESHQYWDRNEGAFKFGPCSRKNCFMRKEK
jgi:hypothetical protein